MPKRLPNYLDLKTVKTTSAAISENTVGGIQLLDKKKVTSSPGIRKIASK